MLLTRITPSIDDSLRNLVMRYEDDLWVISDRHPKLYFTDRNILVNFLQEVIYLTLIANI